MFAEAARADERWGRFSPRLSRPAAPAQLAVSPDERKLVRDLIHEIEDKILIPGLRKKSFRALLKHWLENLESFADMLRAVHALRSAAHRARIAKSTEKNTEKLLAKVEGQFGKRMAWLVRDSLDDIERWQVAVRRLDQARTLTRIIEHPEGRQDLNAANVAGLAWTWGFGSLCAAVRRPLVVKPVIMRAIFAMISTGARDAYTRTRRAEMRLEPDEDPVEVEIDLELLTESG